MKTLFIISKEDLKLACAEFRAVMKKDFQAEDNILIADCNEDEIKKAKKRLAYTNSIFQFLFSCKNAEIEAKMQAFDWKSIYKESFVIRTINGEKIKPEEYYAKFIWRNVKNPKVDLKEAKTKVFLICNKKIHVGIFLGETDKSYRQRKAAMKTAVYPTAIHPKLAKAMVNLTGAEKTDTICDPFCGTGGILVEAAIMGLKTIGCDISDKMIELSKKNMEKNKAKCWHLQVDDATKARIKCDYVVTDLPYGRNSEVTENLDDLYLNFLLNIKKWKIKRAVVCFPDFANYKKIIKKAGLKIIEEFDNYIHKSLSKKIAVLE